jgi:hypothetical protein
VKTSHYSCAAPAREVPAVTLPTIISLATGYSLGTNSKVAEGIFPMGQPEKFIFVCLKPYRPGRPFPVDRLSLRSRGR